MNIVATQSCEEYVVQLIAIMVIYYITTRAAWAQSNGRKFDPRFIPVIAFEYGLAMYYACNSLSTWLSG